MIFAFSYGVLETAIVYFNVGAARPILDLFDYFPFLDVNFPPGGRISSVAYESPALGNYLIAVSGWMFSYILTEKNNLYKFLPTLMVLFLTFFSGSRTAMATVGLQAVILFAIMYAMPQYRRTVTVGFGYVAIVAAIMLAANGENIVRSVDEKLKSLNFSQNLKKNVSNQSRFGMQYASLQVFKEHPVVGVGFGQEAYYTRFEYPGWAKKDNWEFKAMYLNKNFPSFPTSYNLYTRLLAETGIIGVLIWCFMIYLCIANSIRLFKTSKEYEKVLAFILLISFTGMSLNWLQTDFFRQYAFWLCFVIMIRLLALRQATQKELQGQSH
ncbi:O-antigen ligase family protein [Flavobacterium longum]|uniref:O-antigen ligase family protein n=1 Tax=Flavobacterium longum TaxID=1299340 RepID=UPI0039EB847B